MQTCRECGAVWPDGAGSCTDCGADLTANVEEPSFATSADFDQEAERERFEARYGIDIGDRTVDEYLEYLERQDYTLNAWFWVIVGGEIALVGIIGYAVVGPGDWGLLPVFVAISVVLSAAVYADTALVKLFEKWSRIRCLYVAFPLVPVYGQIATFIYLVLRRIERERTEQERRQLNESGFNVEGHLSRD